MALRPRTLTLTAALGGAGVTLLFALHPGLHVAYREPALHASLETTAALVALLAGYLAFGRYQARGSVGDLLLVCGLALLGLSDFFFAALPAALGGDEDGAFATWAVIAGRLGGAILFAAAGFAPRRRLRREGRSHVVALGLCGAFLALVALLAMTLGPSLPPGLDPQEAGAIGRPPLNAVGAVSAVQVLSAVLFAVAALGFLRRAEQQHDGFMRWLAVAATFAAVSRVNYFLYPSLYTQWVYIGDAFRLLFYLVLLAGSMHEIKRYWRRLADAAVMEERRRLARELHDGLAQEIAYIGRNAALLPENGSDGELPQRIRDASERAFNEARRAITALNAPAEVPAEEVVAEALRGVADRHGTRLELDISGGGPLDTDRLEALVRVACEAVTNAARHSGSETVRVELEPRRQRMRLRVVDDGRGFDPAEVDGYGLVGMRERAEAIGGKLRIDSAPGHGTTVEAIL